MPSRDAVALLTAVQRSVQRNAALDDRNLHDYLSGVVRCARPVPLSRAL